MNYGRVEDYLYLEANTSINVTGKIVFARYGKIFRGDKVSWQILCFFKFFKSIHYLTNKHTKTMYGSRVHVHVPCSSICTILIRIYIIGYIFCDQVRLAQTRGAIGVILFSDPEDVTNGDMNQVYPNDYYLPPSGTQRGTVYIGDGDPLTAGYPAIGKNKHTSYVFK